MKFIKVKTQFEGVHSYPQAPDDVAFLRNEHRHKFGVTLILEVAHNEREFEFFQVKKSIDSYTKQFENAGAKSCETMAEMIMQYFASCTVHIRESEQVSRRRFIRVEVDEDGENSAIVDNAEDFK